MSTPIKPPPSAGWGAQHSSGLIEFEGELFIEFGCPCGAEKTWVNNGYKCPGCGKTIKFSEKIIQQLREIMDEE